MRALVLSFTMIRTISAVGHIEARDRDPHQEYVNQREGSGDAVASMPSCSSGLGFSLV
jgi:hypothetical protein